MIKMVSAMTRPNPEMKWNAIISSRAVEGVLKAKDATEAYPIVAMPKAPSRKAVAPKFSDVPVNSFRCISKKTPNVQMRTHM